MRLWNFWIQIFACRTAHARALDGRTARRGEISDQWSCFKTREGGCVWNDFLQASKDARHRHTRQREGDGIRRAARVCRQSCGTAMYCRFAASSGAWCFYTTEAAALQRSILFYRGAFVMVTSLYSSSTVVLGRRKWIGVQFGKKKRSKSWLMMIASLTPPRRWTCLSWTGWLWGERWSLERMGESKWKRYEVSLRGDSIETVYLFTVWHRIEHGEILTSIYLFF